jgi:4-hydroxy-2-oxoglutarate aldolase
MSSPAGLRLEGVFAPVTTPFDEEGQIVESAFVRNLQRYGQTGLAGVLVAGTTGEGVHLDASERHLLLELAAQAAGRLQLLAGLPGQSVVQSVRELRAWEQFPLRAVLAAVPSYYRPRMTENAVETYYRMLADESPFPILLYNIPRLTGIELGARLVSRLARHPRIAGIKESSGNLGLVQRLLEDTAGHDFAVLSGSAETFGAAVDLGVRGGILAAACMVPDLAVAVLCSAGDPAGSADLRRRLFELASAVVAEGGVAGIKAAMDETGFEGMYTRLPLGQLLPEERERIHRVLSAQSRTLRPA